MNLGSIEEALQVTVFFCVERPLLAGSRRTGRNREISIRQLNMKPKAEAQKPWPSETVVCRLLLSPVITLNYDEQLICDTPPSSLNSCGFSR